MVTDTMDAMLPMAPESCLNLDENLHKAIVRALLCVGRRSGESVC